MLTMIKYVTNVKFTMTQKNIELELLKTPAEKGKTLIIRLDSFNKYAVIGINSIHKLYCQLIFLSIAAGIGKLKICYNRKSYSSC